MRYAQENAEKNVTLKVSARDFPDIYRQQIDQIFEIKLQFSWRLFKFWTSAMILPLVAVVFGLSNGYRGQNRFESKIVCEVDGTKTKDMFSHLFADLPKERLIFVTEHRYAREFNDLDDIHIVGLDKNGRKEIIKAAVIIGLRSAQYIKQLTLFDSDLFYVFYDYIRGKAGTINGNHNVYCTFEHCFNVKAVRNEMLRATGNRSIFVPLNTYVTNEHWYPEFMLNYDVVLSAGSHIKDLYSRKRAKNHQISANWMLRKSPEFVRKCQPS